MVQVDPLTGKAEAVDVGEVVGRALRLIQLRPGVPRAVRSVWHDVVRPRLRPVLIEIGIASVVLNLMALIMPIFLMTVYNKVINHGALGTLDVLAIGMITLFLFSGCCAARAVISRPMPVVGSMPRSAARSSIICCTCRSARSS